MYKLLITAALAASMIVLPGTSLAGKRKNKPAPAQPAPAQPGAHSSDGSDCAKAKKRGKRCKLMIFGADDVRGDRPIASGERVTVATTRAFGNLLRLRLDFRDRIIAAAEDVD